MTTGIEVAPPPEVPRAASRGLPALLLSAVLSAAMLGVTGWGFFAGTPTARHPAFVAAPVIMSVSLMMTVFTGFGRRRVGAINADRDRYFGYLSILRCEVTKTGVAQRSSLTTNYPDPASLWTLVGGPRMWLQRPGDAGFCSARVGIGPVPLTTPLVAASAPGECDPVSSAAQQRFLRTHSTIEAPVVVRLAGRARIDGDVDRVRDLLRAIICGLAATHAPDHLQIAALAGDSSRGHWDWLKWLPHHRHPSAIDHRSAVVILDAGEPTQAVPPGAVLLEVGAAASSLTLRLSGTTLVPDVPDGLGAADALAFARRLAGYGDPASPGGRDWAGLFGIGDVRDFDPEALWCSTNRLCVPIGTTIDGHPVQLDIKEAAESGMGPHGLCVGATGTGKSELLRTVALGMMACNSPAALNLLLIDFKGGATFLEFADAPHVAAVVTNLADEAHLVARMRDAMAGEINRRQRVLRSAGAAGITAYNTTRGAGSATLPALFIIVDEFSELLTQHPDFADTFLAIGRLGRSLGMHLLLASQRLDEGRLRGLEAHLSYRICLKTLSAAESRTALGTLEAYELPTTPGAALLRIADGEPVRFQAALVSGPLPARPVAESTTVHRFTAEPGEPDPVPGEACEGSVLRTVLDRLSGHGPTAHRVWLPPLHTAPPLHQLLLDRAPTWLAVPVGVVDRPFDQSRRPLTVELSGAAGNVAVVGAPRSGKSTALCTLLTALAATHDPEQVQFYCLDFGGGALASLRALPHVGDVADRTAPELVRRMVAEIRSMIRGREGRDRSAAGSPAEVFLVVDGWASLRHEFEAIEEAITAIASQGLSFGVHVMLSASRWADLRPALKDQIGTRIELRLGDPADSELDRRQARHVPADRPGRGLSRDGLHMMVAVPPPHGVEFRRGTRAAPIPLLPLKVDHRTVVDNAPGGVVLGVEERQMLPLTVDFERHHHLLILGDNGCGKTAALRLLCREIVRTRTSAQARLFIVDFRRSLLGAVESDHLGGYAMSPAALSAMLPELTELLHRRMPGAEVSQAQLRARSWWTGPDVYLVVDDYDLAATSLSSLLEYLSYATDLGLHIVVARRTGGAARALYEPLLAALRDLGCLAMMMSGRPEDGALLGSSPPMPLPPGRGRLINRPGDEQLVQVAWSAPG